MGQVVNYNINARIERICDELFEGNATKMAKATFVARSTLNSIIGDTQASPGYETLRRIVDMSAYKINPNWLLTGAGEMLLADTPSADISAVIERPIPTKPHIEDVSAVAGYNSGGAAQSVMGGTVSERPVIMGMPDYDMTIRVNGDSMYPYLCSGDLIAIREIDMFKFKPGEIYVVSTDEDAFVKRVFRSNMDGMVIRCESINPSFPPFDLAADSILKMYRVVGLQRLI